MAAETFLAPGVGICRARRKLACPGLAKTCHRQLFGRSAARIGSRLAANPFDPHQSRKTTDKRRSFFYGSGGGDRTHDKWITLIFRFPESVDYIIVQSDDWMQGASAPPARGVLHKG